MDIDYFQSFAIISNAAMNNLVYVSFHICYFKNQAPDFLLGKELPFFWWISLPVLSEQSTTYWIA